MANPEHLKILKKGPEVWNKWREKGHEEIPDLSEVDLSRANLSGANLSGVLLKSANLTETDLIRADLENASLTRAILKNAVLEGAKLLRADLREADLTKAILRKADLCEAELCNANLYQADLSMANLFGANLRGANLNEVDLHKASLINVDLSKSELRKADLFGANLSMADLSEADLSEADLRVAVLSWAKLSKAILINVNLERAQLVNTILNGANLSGSRIYGISAWGLELREAIQTGLIITSEDEPTITVDNLEVAQFIYLLLHNEKIRNVIDTITSKVVLILGRFTDKRKTILDALRDDLRRRNYLPVLFDFDKPTIKDLTETISTLAHMARFIIADITEPRCIPHELATIVPTLSVPVQPLLLEGAEGEYAMFRDLSKYPWVLTIYKYKNLDELIQSIEAKVIAPAEEKAKALIESKNR